MILLPWEVSTDDQLYPWHRKGTDGYVRVHLVLDNTLVDSRKEPWGWYVYDNGEILQGSGPTIGEAMNRADCVARRFYRLLTEEEFEKLKCML
jgi:hypothetical protein